jgi:hypothetical protein
VDGVDLPTELIQRGGELTELEIRLPAAFITKPEIEVALSNGNPEPLKFGFLEIR